MRGDAARAAGVTVVLPVAEGWQEADPERAAAATRANADFRERMAALGGGGRSRVAKRPSTAVELIEEAETLNDV